MVFDPILNRTQLFTGLILVFIAWSIAVLILALLATRATAQSFFDLELARHILDSTTAQAGEIANMVETARILRHDCKHHLHVAQILLETGKIQEAREYLLAFGTKCDESAVPMFCANPCVNALLNGYRKRSMNEGIAFSAMVELPENPPMDNFELCTLLGNLLENALEACRKAPEGQRRITLNGAPQGNQLLISVKNTFDGTVLKEEGHIVSRKGESGGLGITSIRTIAGRHHGEYVPEWNENTFTASVMLRL
jgi:sensor histidine kinase regulating citrate/malate metabolism